MTTKVPVELVSLDGGIVINESSADADFRVESNGNANMLFVDGGNDVITIGGSTYESGDTFSVTEAGANSVNTRLVNTNADANGVKLILEKNSSSPADSDELGEIAFLGKDDAGNANTYAGIRVFADDVTNGSEDGSMTFSTLKAATFNEQMKINSSGYIEFAGASDVRVTIGSQGTPGTNDANWIRGDSANFGHNTPGDYYWEVSGTKVARLDADGLRFGTDTAAANGLDDYEEGTWTPTVGGNTAQGSTSSGSVAGKYIKIGKLVFASFSIVNITIASASGHLKIGGFPFNNDGTNDREAVGVMRVYGVDIGALGTYGTPLPAVNDDTNTAFVLQSGDDAAWNVVQVSNDSGQYFEGSITYIAT
tara:strand:- start:337 stop:1434 length:1098 start_codon:yes stop_codon:yes gene_type:complete